MNPGPFLACLALGLALGFLPSFAHAAAGAKNAAPHGFVEPRFTQTDRAQRVRAVAEDIESIYRSFAMMDHCPGVAYGVVVDDTLVVSGGVGVLDVVRHTPVTAQSVFRIASMTKSFTAMSVLRLRDRHQLDLDRPLARYLPEMRRLPPPTSDSPALTPRLLLTHSAGFPEDNPWGDRQLADTEQELIELVRGPIQFSTVPGTAYEYSNLGFALLGRLVHRVSGMSCQQYIDRQVLRPLGMTSTYWEPARVPKERLAHGYRRTGMQFAEEPQLPDGSFAPMGGLLTSIEDFSRYMALHLAAWPPRDGPEPGPIRRASLREMQQPWRFNDLNAKARNEAGDPCPTARAYGYGLRWTRDCQGRTSVGHTGGLPGFGSEWHIYPEYGFGVVGFGNVTYAGLARANRKVSELILTKAGLNPRELPTSDILRERVTQLAAVLRDWDPAQANEILAVNFLDDYPINGPLKDAKALFEAIGPVRAIESIKPENQLRGTATIEGPRGSLLLSITLTPENPPRIQEFKLIHAPETSASK